MAKWKAFFIFFSISKVVFLQLQITFFYNNLDWPLELDCMCLVLLQGIVIGVRQQGSEHVNVTMKQLKN